MRIFNKEISNAALVMMGAVVVIILLISSIFLGILPGSKPQKAGQATLEFWGLFDSASVWQPLFDEYRKTHSNTFFKYTQMEPAAYEQKLIEALASGKSPDIIMFRSSWLPKHGNKISPLPETMMTLRTFQETFPDVATIDFVSSGKIYALPVWTDALSMFYNKDLFNTAGVAVPPKTWEDFIKVVQKLTSKDKSGNLLKSGAAVGAADNVDNAADILSLLMLQTGTRMISDDGAKAVFDQAVTVNGTNYKPGESALRFYTDFANPKSGAYVWNNNLPNSFDAFASGQAAIIFDYAVNIPRLKQKAPNLRLGVAPIPQLSGESKTVNYADFWGYSVPAASKNSVSAWEFIIFLTGVDTNRYFANAVSRPAARRDVLNEEKSSPDLGVFAESVLSATNWYQTDPAAVENIFKDMLNAVVLRNTTPADAISDAAARVSSLMRKNEF
ncbi:MAG: extracellular solute-binding protein [Candidatus Azambacteria bacterium]|nr:extracellular solute-binding protein [Candidatus Azambacteria bacterium]